MKIRSLLYLSALAIACAPSALSAQTYHTYVASYGNDANTGSSTDPYASFAQAAASTAEGGVITALTPGDFGAVTISHAVTIDGAPGASVTFSGNDGIFVNAAATDAVTVRNLHINGLGIGTDAVYVQSAASFVMEDCVLENFTYIGLAIGDTTTIKVNVRNTTIHGGQIGFRSFQSSGNVFRMQASLETVTITGATYAGVFSRNGSLTITNSVISQSAVALQVDTSAQIEAHNSTLSGNTIAIQPYSSSVIRLSNCAILANHTVFSAAGGKFVTDGNNRLADNVTNGPAPSSKMTIE